MNILGIGYDTRHNADFIISRPSGYGAYLFLLIRTPSFHIIHQQLQHISAPAVVFYDPVIPQKYGAAGTAYLDDWIQFSLSAEELLQWEQRHIPFNTIVPLADDTEISAFLRQMSLEFYSANTRKNDSLNLYMQLLLNKVQEQSDAVTVPASGSLYEQLVRLRSDIYNHPQASYSAAEAAKDMAVSVSCLQHRYRDLFGTTFVRDRINSRIQTAKKMLAGTDSPVSQIAAYCGYDYDVYFMRQFRQETGMTPLEFRKKESCKKSPLKPDNKI